MPDDGRLRRRVQLVPNMQVGEKAAQEPMSQEDVEGLAQMAVLSGATTNTQIRSFLGNLNNQVFSQYVQQATQ